MKEKYRHLIAIITAVIICAVCVPNAPATAAETDPGSQGNFYSHAPYENGISTYADGVSLGEIFAPRYPHVWIEPDDFEDYEDFLSYCDDYGIDPNAPCPKSFDEFWDALGKKLSSSDKYEGSDASKTIEIVDPVNIEGIADNYIISFDFRLYPGRQKRLWAYTYASSKDTVKWASSDESVATVDDRGLVTALTAGTTTITASLGDLSDAYELTVKDPGDRLTTPKNTIAKYYDLTVKEKYNSYGQKSWRKGSGDLLDTKWSYKYTKSGLPYSHEYVFKNKSDEPFEDYSDCDKIYYNSEGGIRKVLRYENGKPYGKVLLYYDSNNRLKKIKRYTADEEGKWVLKWTKKYT